MSVNYKIDLFTSDTYNSPCFQAGLDFFHHSRDELNQKLITLILKISEIHPILIQDRKVETNELTNTINELFSKEYGNQETIQLQLENSNTKMIINRDELGMNIIDPDKELKKMIKKYVKQERLHLY